MTTGKTEGPILTVCHLAAVIVCLFTIALEVMRKCHQYALYKNAESVKNILIKVLLRVIIKFKISVIQKVTSFSVYFYNACL